MVDEIPNKHPPEESKSDILDEPMKRCSSRETVRTHQPRVVSSQARPLMTGQNELEAAVMPIKQGRLILDDKALTNKLKPVRVRSSKLIKLEKDY